LSHPEVSVIVPMLDAASFIDDALDSIVGQRDIAPDTLEVIVVDNGSTDDSVARVERRRDRRVRLLSEPQRGAAAARNLGISAAMGRYLAFLDADDRWTPSKLAPQIAALEREAGADLVFGHFVTIDHSGRLRGDAPAPSFSLGSLLARRDCFARIGPLTTAFEVGEFIDWFTRAEDAGLHHLMLADVALERRVHQTNTTARRAARADYARVVRLAVSRRGLVGKDRR
jgi:glycosyltransferase involved in cell wall biosynthesis